MMEITLFTSIYRLYYKITYMVVHKASLNIFQRLKYNKICFLTIEMLS